MIGALVAFVTLVALFAAKRHLVILAARSAPPKLERPKELQMRFERSLELGLHLVHHAGARAGVASVRRADDLARTLGLFTRETREALDEAAKHGLVEVSDTHVTLALDRTGSFTAEQPAIDLALHQLRRAIDAARAELAPLECLASQHALFRAVAERLGGRLEPWPLSVTFPGPALVHLVAARTNVRCFDVRASLRLAPPGERRQLPERIRRFLERGLGAGTLGWDDGFVTLLLGDDPHPTLVTSATRRLVRLARLVGAGHATRPSYRESPATARARRR